MKNNLKYSLVHFSNDVDPSLREWDGHIMGERCDKSINVLYRRCAFRVRVYGASS